MTGEEINQSMANYPLRSLAPALRACRPPEGAFDPAGPWRQAWGIYTLASRVGAAAHRVGEMRLARQLRPGGAVVLTMSYRKTLTGGSEAVAAELHTRIDRPLSTPSRWTFETKVLDAAGRDVPLTALKRSGEARDGAIVIEDHRERKTISVAGDWTVNWCLFDAVQRLPRRSARPAAFTLIDHFDQPKPETTLAFRRQGPIAFADGRAVPAWSFEQLGRGNVPWVYWLDEPGRLLCVVAGLEGYLLETSDAG